MDQRVTAFMGLLEDLASKQPFDAAQRCEDVVKLTAPSSSPGVPETAKPTFAATKMLLGDQPSIAQDLNTVQAALAPAIKQLSDLTVASKAACMAHVRDQYGFHDCVNEDAASNLARAALANILPYLYIGHLNRGLQAGMQKTLQELAADGAFVEAFRAKLKDPSTAFLEEMGQQASQTKSPDFALNLLFVNEFFAQGIPVLVASGGQGTAQPAFPSVVNGWASRALQTKAIADSPGLPKFLTGLVSAVGHITAPTGTLNAQPRELLGTITQDTGSALAKALQSTVQDQAAAAADHQQGRSYYKTIGQEMAMRWATCCETYFRAPMEAAISGKKTIPLLPFIFMGGFSGTEALKFMRDNMHLQIFYPDRVDRVADAVYSKGPIKSETMEKVVETIGGFVHFQTAEKPAPLTKAAFVGGAEVLVQDPEQPADGTKADPKRKSIELLVGTDDVLQAPGKYVEAHVTPVVGTGAPICGINGQQAYFTSDAVFQTTTGLRAVDAVRARTRNPWLVVGALNPGHVLQRLNGSTYDPVTVDSIEGPFENSSAGLYALTTASTSTNYHVNGFLMHDSRPQDQIIATAKSMQEVPRDKQAEMLQTCPEIQPLFDRYGMSLIMDIFGQQIDAIDKTDFVMQSDDSPLFNSNVDGWDPAAPNLLDYEIQWAVIDQANEGLSTIGLSDLAVYQGVLWVDGDYCERANIDSMGNTLAWSRRTENGYQHACCALNDDLLEGKGFLFNSSDLDPSSAPSGDDRQWFRLVPRSSGLYCPKFTAAEPGADVFQSVSMTSSRNGVVMTDEAHPESSQRTTKMPSMAEISANDDTFDGSTAVFSNKLSSRSVTLAAEYSELPFSWDLSWDTQPWPFIDTDDDGLVPPPSPETTKPLFNIQAVRNLKTGDLTYAISVLDNLRAAIDKRAQEEYGLPPGSIAALYNVTSSGERLAAQKDIVSAGGADNVDIGNRSACFEICDGGVIAAYADSFEHETGVLPTKDLTFTKMGVEGSLPCLFSELNATFRSMEVSCGVLREFDPTAEHCKGAKHTIKGTYLDPHKGSKPPQNEVVAKTPSSNDTHTPPAPAVNLPRTDVTENAPLQLKDLDNPMVSDGQIKKLAQKYLQQAMLFHMDEQALGILNTTRPTSRPHKQMEITHQLPRELAEDLTDSLKRWLRETYGRAYVGQMIATASADILKNVVADARMGPDEIKRLNYWWTGNGKKCLAGSVEYTRLNELAVRYAMLVASKNTNLGKFVEEDAKLQGESSSEQSWAFKFFDWKMKHLMDVAYETESQQKQATDGYTPNEVQRICNILQLLQPIARSEENDSINVAKQSKPYSIQFADAVLLVPTLKASLKPYVGPEAGLDSEYVFLENAMKAMLEDLFDSDPNSSGGKYSNAFCKSLRDALEEPVKQFMDERKKQATNEMLTKQATMGQAAHQFLQSIGAFAHLREASKAAAKLEVAGESAFARAMRTGKEAVKSCPWTAQQTMKSGAKAVMGITAAVVLAAAAFNIYMAAQHWGIIPDYNKMKFITGAALGIMDALSMVGNLLSAFSLDKANAAARNRVLGMPALKGALTAKSVRPTMIQVLKSSMPDGVTARREVMARRNAVLVNSGKVKGPLQSTQALADKRKRRRGGILFKEEPRAPGKAYVVWGRVMGAITFVLSICMLVASIWELNAEWSERSTTSRALSVCAIIFAGLAVIAEGFCLLAGFGLFVAVGAVCAWLGPILVVIGVVFLLVELFTREHKEPERKPTEMETYLKGIVKDAVKKLPEEPTSRFGWVVTPKSAHSEQDAVLAVSGVSPGSQDDTNGLVLGKITLAYTVGASSSVLFSAERLPKLAEVTDPAKTPGSGQFRTTISPSDAQHPIFTAPMAGTLQEGMVGQKIEGDMTASPDYSFSWELRMSSTPNNHLTYIPSLPLVLPHDVTVKVEIAGKIAAKGKATLTMTEYWYDSDKAKPGVAGALRESMITRLDVQKE